MQLALIGKSIGKSRMPRLQMHLGEMAGLSLDYQLFEVDNPSDFSLSAALMNFHQQGYVGVNITQPFKQVAWDFVTALKPTPSLLGAYNTIKFASSFDELDGVSTDFSGFVSAYRRVMGNAAPGKVLLAGAGGVGRSVAFGLAELGCEELYIYDTNIQQARDLAAALGHINCHIVDASSSFEKYAQQVNGLVNCTPYGMYYMPESVVPKHVIGGQQWAFDAVYTPLCTEFVSSCQDAGLTIISGFDLWLHQGLDAFEIFTSVKIEATQQLITETLQWLD